MNSGTFANQVIEAFSFLTNRYGFSEAEVENLGREVCVDFHRNNETVSVSMETGAAPIIELFLLCEGTSIPPVPWAERNGKQRFRKFPELAAIKNFFVDAPKEFEKTEHEWLKT